MPQKALFAAAQFIPLPVWNRQLDVLPRDAIPEILDKLQALRSPEFEQRREFLVHEPDNILSVGIVQEHRLWCGQEPGKRIHPCSQNVGPRKSTAPAGQGWAAMRWIIGFPLKGFQ